MALSNKRIGRITSSEIVALTSNDRSGKEPGAPFYTYVEERVMMRFFKRRLEKDVETLPMAWGKLCEKVVHDMLPFKYTMQSEISYIHERYDEWLGTPDGTIKVDGKVDTITDIKCPSSLKAFYNLVSGLYDFDGVEVKKKTIVDGNELIKSIRKNSKEGEKYYWQLVSNACIMKAKFAELIVFVPYYEQLEEIKIYNSSLDEPYWSVERAKIDELPYIYEESGIENLNIIRFEIPLEDKIFLEQRVKKAIELINK